MTHTSNMTTELPRITCNCTSARTLAFWAALQRLEADPYHHPQPHLFPAGLFLHRIVQDDVQENLFDFGFQHWFFGALGYPGVRRFRCGIQGKFGTYIVTPEHTDDFAAAV